MKILMLTPYLPYPPESGGQIRTLNLLKYLSKHNEITLISLYKNEREKAYAKHLEPFCKAVYVCKRPEKPWTLKNIATAVLTILPFLIVRNYSQEAKQVIAQLLKTEHFDIIHAETFYIMPHLPETTTPVFLVEQTIECKVYEHYLKSLPALLRWALYLDIYKLRFWEKFYWRKATVVSTVSEYDRDALRSMEKKIDPIVIPNGAGDDMFVDALPKKDMSHPELLFVGNFSWLQNIEAAQYLINEIYPKLAEAIPSIRLIIAGQRAEKLHEDTIPAGITITPIKQGDSEKITSLYANSTAFIAPIYGPGGTRLKILAAMAAGLPVVSSQTGVEGLDVTDGTHVLIANTPQEFVSHTQKLLSKADIYYHLQKNSYALAKKTYSWKAISQHLEKVYKEVSKNYNVKQLNS